MGKLSLDQLNIFKPLLNIIELLNLALINLKKKNQELQDENNRLKGEQGKPDIKPNKNKDISSETDRNNSDNRKKKRKKRTKKNLQYHEKIIQKMDKEKLPSDAISKGYSKKIYQGLKIQSHNILIEREIYYSPSEKRNYVADLPAGFDSSTYTPELKALIVNLKFNGLMSEPKLLRFLKDYSVQITPGTISNILINLGKNIFQKEKEEIYSAGLESAPYQQTDTTSVKENGKNLNSHIFCNELYSAFYTRDRRDRSTVLDILREGKPRKYRLNEEAFKIFKALHVSKQNIQSLMPSKTENELDGDELESIILQYLPKVKELCRQKIMDSAYLAGYHAENHINILVTDDAPQYRMIADYSALCWIHDGRHYKKLSPVILPYQKNLSEFITGYWSYYKLLLNYKKNPSEMCATILDKKFDKLFSTVTGYDELDKRIHKTKSKKEQLLLVLKYSMIPLHNNDSELGARVIVRHRDVSLQTKSRDGTNTRDALFTVIETARKLGVNVYHYLLDRIHKLNEMPSLASRIRMKGATSFP